MDIKELYMNGIDFEKFINTADDETSKNKCLEIYNNIKIDDDLKEKINTVNKKIYVLAFAEIWCPDCVINIPALKKICDLNQNINMKIVSRKGNEAYLEDYKVGGKAKIPTFIFMDSNFNVLGTFIEVPEIIKEIVNKGNQVEIIVAKRKYRKGEFAEETIKDILRIIE